MWCVRETRRQSCVRPVGRRGRRGGSPGPAARGCSLRWARRERFSSGTSTARTSTTSAGTASRSSATRTGGPTAAQVSSGCALGVVEHSQKCFASHRLERRRSPPRRTRRSGGQGTCRCSLGAHCHSSSLSLSLSSSPIHENPGLPPVTLPDFLTSTSARLAGRFFLFFGGGGPLRQYGWGRRRGARRL